MDDKDWVSDVSRMYDVKCGPDVVKSYASLTLKHDIIVNLVCWPQDQLLLPTTGPLPNPLPGQRYLRV